MLARDYRFTVLNGCGQTLAASAVTIQRRGKKFDSAGAQSFESSETNVYANGSTQANNAYASGSAVANNTDLLTGGEFEVTVVAPASAAGDITVFYEVSTDGGTTWPTNGNGFFMCAVSVTASATFVKHFIIE